MAQLANPTRQFGQGFEPVPLELPIDDQLTLRLSDESSVQAMYDLFDANRPRLVRWLATAEDYTLEAAISHEQRSRHLRQSGRYAPYGIVMDGALNGEVELYRVNSLSAKMGYWRADDGRREGVMARSARRLVDFGFEVWGLHNIVLEIEATNQPSEAVAVSIGARPNGDYHKKLDKKGRAVRFNRWVLTR